MTGFTDTNLRLAKFQRFSGGFYFHSPVKNAGDVSYKFKAYVLQVTTGRKREEKNSDLIFMVKSVSFSHTNLAFICKVKGLNPINSSMSHLLVNGSSGYLGIQSAVT